MESDRGYDSNQWSLGAAKSVTMDQFWTCYKVYRRNAAGNHISGADSCTYFDKELWFDLVKIMWINHKSVFQDHLKYMHNYIVKPFRVGII